MQSSSRTYERNGRRYRYRYQAVTAGGHGVRSKDYVDMGAAMRTVERIKAGWPDAELQRVREFLVGRPGQEIVEGRQYELMRNGRWVPESLVEDESESQEDRS